MTSTTFPTESSAIDELQQLFGDDARFSLTDRKLYSSDASFYQEIPLGVFRPRSTDDIVKVVHWANKYQIPLIPRAAGTSLAGQVVGKGLVVDISRYLNQIGTINIEDHWVDVEPGVILDDLNDRLSSFGLHFGPDTSTSNRCMIGGMIGNNSCGEHSIAHGTTRDHTLSVDAVLSDGSTARFEALKPDELEQKKKLNSLEGEIYRNIIQLIEENKELILEKFPSPDLIRRNTGYPLDYLAMSKPFNPNGPEFNLAPFLCGTEGTLGFTIQAKMNLVPNPKARALLCCHFNTVDEACEANWAAVQTQPAAIELIDGTILNATKSNLEQSRNRFWLQGDPGAVLIVEYFGESMDEVREKAKQLEATYLNDKRGHAFTHVEGPDIKKVWALRKAGLGLLMGLPKEKKAQPLIEDAAVPVHKLPEYVKDIRNLLDRYNTSCIYYAHASVGLLHLRPELDLKDPKDRETFEKIGWEFADLVMQYGGSISGEHGDGRLRAPLLEKVFGKEVVRLFNEVKTIFDPKNLFNPGIIVDPKPMLESIRQDQQPSQPFTQTVYDWSQDGGFLSAAEKCNGAGACRKSSGRGTLCPSYQATLEEMHSTRGRSNLIRHSLSSSDPESTFNDPGVLEALDLCLSCKACKSECPASVDMARLKAEILQQKHLREGASLRSRFFADFIKGARHAQWAPKLFSKIANTALFKKIIGVHPQRSIPEFADENFAHWWSKHQKPTENPDLVLFIDEFTQYLEPQIAIAALEVLQSLNIKALPLFDVDSCRAAISKGFLLEARERLHGTLNKLMPYIEAKLPIVGLEPSAILGFKDELPDLFPPESHERKALRQISERVFLFEEYLLNHADQLNLKPYPHKILIHGHCHAKSLVGIQALTELMKKIPQADVHPLNTGCCGMAGSFGYEKEHFDVSMKLAHDRLLPAIQNEKETFLLCAHGTSCRHQVLDGLQRTAYHPAELLRDFLI